jgi:protein-disulfide isomerase-like protein with CxxC motif
MPAIHAGMTEAAGAKKAVQYWLWRGGMLSGERKIMNRHVVKCLFRFWLRLRCTGSFFSRMNTPEELLPQGQLCLDSYHAFF